jgi:transposase-like protein
MSLPIATLSKYCTYEDPDTFDFMSIVRFITVDIVCPYCKSENRHGYSGTFYDRRCGRCASEYALEPFNTVIHRQFPSCKIEFKF